MFHLLSHTDAKIPVYYIWAWPATVQIYQHIIVFLQSGKTAIHFEQSFLMYKCLCNINPTRSFYIITMPANSCNFILYNSNRFCEFLMFSSVGVSFECPLHYLHQCLCNYFRSHHINVLLLFLIERSPDNTFRVISLFKQYFSDQEAM